MDMIVWRERFLAFAIHFLVTLVLAAIAAALIFLVWFPDPFQTMVGGTELFELVVVCDLALGPLISLVIYDSRKARREADHGLLHRRRGAARRAGLRRVHRRGHAPGVRGIQQDRLEVVTGARHQR